GMLVLIVTAAWGQVEGIRLVTHPKPPTRDVLDRLSMVAAWNIKVKTEGERDGLLSVQVIPGRTPRDNPQVVVQTLYGAVLLLDGENGDIIWRTTVGQPYWPGHPAAHNSTSILVARREFLFILDRANGLHRVATVDRDTRVPDFGMQMLGAP